MRVCLKIFMAALSVFFLWNAPAPACGVYLSSPADMAVEGADGKLLKQSWSAVIAADDGQVTFTMANDYLGDAAKFALLFPVPEILTREQVTVIDPEIFTRLRSCASPRLVTVSEAAPGWDDPRMAERVTENWLALLIVFAAGLFIVWLLYITSRGIAVIMIVALVISLFIVVPPICHLGSLHHERRGVHRHGDSDRTCQVHGR